MHHLPLVVHANFYKNQSLYFSEELPHEKCPDVSLELTMQHYFLKIIWFSWDFFFLVLIFSMTLFWVEDGNSA